MIGCLKFRSCPIVNVIKDTNKLCLPTWCSLLSVKHFEIRALNLMFITACSFLFVFCLSKYLLQCQLWVGPGSKAAEEKRFFDSHLAPFYRIEQVCPIVFYFFLICQFMWFPSCWLIVMRENGIEWFWGPLSKLFSLYGIPFCDSNCLFLLFYMLFWSKMFQLSIFGSVFLFP